MGKFRESIVHSIFPKAGNFPIFPAMPRTMGNSRTRAHANTTRHRIGHPCV
jgi:hypothetical protein